MSAKVKCLVGQLLAGAPRPGELEHRGAGGHVLDREPDRLEERHVGGLASARGSGDDVAQ